MAEIFLEHAFALLLLRAIQHRQINRSALLRIVLGFLLGVYRPLKPLSFSTSEASATKFPKMRPQLAKRPHRQQIPPELSMSTTQSLSLLSNSDAELITSTTQRIEVAELSDDNTDFWKRV